MAPAGSSKCPYCNEEIIAQPELPFGSLQCSECRERVWLLTVCGERTFFRYEAASLVRHLFEGLAAEQVLPDALGSDALDEFAFITTFLAELEEAI